MGYCICNNSAVLARHPRREFSKRGSVTNVRFLKTNTFAFRKRRSLLTLFRGLSMLRRFFCNLREAQRAHRRFGHLFTREDWRVVKTLRHHFGGSQYEAADCWYLLHYEGVG